MDEQAHQLETRRIDSRALEDSEGAGPLPLADLRAPAHGERFGRYMVLSTLGEGGMGVVLCAYDPDLQRRVALKLLKLTAHHSPTRRARLQREALALARLNHRNVVTIYDVGCHDGQLFIAMELVEGQTLGDWGIGRERPRPWREVLAHFDAAGRGLAAIHEAGLIHRDFKPQNVMLGADESVRVMDLGLARVDGEALDEASRDSSSEGLSGDYDDTAGDGISNVTNSNVGSLERELTQAGTLLGTPAYMAPEQFRRARSSPHTDQFAFCVALFQALYGNHPFGRGSFDSLKMRTLSGAIHKPRHQQAPAWLLPIIERGLSVDPSARFPDMHALLSALAAGERRRRRQLFAGVACSCALALGLGWGAREVQLEQGRERCADQAAEIREVWNDDTRADFRTRVLASNTSYATTALDKLLPMLDAQAARWQQRSYEVCVATKVEQRWSADRYARASWCLVERKAELSLLSERADDLEGAKLGGLVLEASRLQPLSTCVDPGALDRMSPPPPSPLLPEATALNEEISRAASLDKRGRYAQGLEVVRAARARFARLDWGPLELGLDIQELALLSSSGRHDEAEAVGVAAYLEATTTDNWDHARTAALILTQVVSANGRHDEGLLWSKLGEAALERTGDPLGLYNAHLDEQRALVLLRKGEREAAIEGFERGVAARRAVFGPTHPTLIAGMLNAGVAHDQAGRYEQSRALYTEALAISEASLGREHPYTASILHNLSINAIRDGREHEAEAPAREAYAIRRRVLEPDHPDLANNLELLAHLAANDERFELAIAYLTEVIEVRSLGHGDEHALMARSWLNLAQTQAEANIEEARTSFERALEFALHDPDDPSLGPAHLGLAKLAAEDGDREAQRAHAKRASELFVQGEAASSPEAAEARALLADASSPSQPEGA